MFNLACKIECFSGEVYGEIKNSIFSIEWNKIAAMEVTVYGD